jgi:hypothetical protein
MEALVAVAEVAFVVAEEVAIAETATEAIVAAAEVAMAGMKAIGVVEEVAIVVAEAGAKMEVMGVMTRGPIRRILWLLQERTENNNSNPLNNNTKML